MNMLDKLKIYFFIILFAWISFFPQPLQDRYGIYSRIFLFIFLLLLILNKKYRQGLFSSRDWPLWLFLVSLLAGTVTAMDRNIAFRTYWYLAINLFLLFYIGKGLYRFDKDRNRVSMVICLVSGLVAAIGIFELIFAFNPLYAYFIQNPYYERYISGWVRPISMLFNPAPLASYLLLSLPFAVHILKQKAFLKKACGAVVITLNSVCLISTFCRSSFLGLLFMLLCFLLITRRYKKFALVFLLLILFMMLASVLPYPFNRVSPQGIGIYGTGIFSQYRMARLEMALAMLKKSPIFGVGLNHFRVLFDGYYPVKAHLAYIDYEIKIADNMHLTLLAETGIIGFIGFLVFIVFLLRRALGQIARFKDKSAEQALLFPLLSLIGLLLSMAGYELFYWSSPYMLFCLICGFIQGSISEAGV